MEQSTHTIYLDDSIEVKETPDCGRGVFAKQKISKGTILLDTSFISVKVLLREYRKEVCAQCFTYDLGKHLPYRNAEVNFSFCSPVCQEEWTTWTGELGMEAWKTLETFVKSKGKGGHKGIVDGTVEPVDEDGDVAMGDYPRRPTKQEIEDLWIKVEEKADLIRQHRQGQISKRTRKEVATALSVAVHPDTMYFLLDGILIHHASTTADDIGSQKPWTSFQKLAAAEDPYPNAFQLRNHINSYLHLLSILPLALLPSITSTICLSIVSHDSHNAFGIRSLDDLGSEFFGWGVWPDASYFNHSCGYNVNKVRQGRTWRFLAGRTIDKDEELTITYLGGNEKEISAKERGERTMSIWGFVCACALCVTEKEKLEMSSDETNSSVDSSE